MSDDVDDRKYRDCSDLTDNDITCCMSCDWDEENGYGSVFPREDKKGNIWQLCCRHLEFFNEIGIERQ
jgi:hypothetical protein